jgi:hypothetical protein
MSITKSDSVDHVGRKNSLLSFRGRRWIVPMESIAIKSCIVKFAVLWHSTDLFTSIKPYPNLRACPRATRAHTTQTYTVGLTSSRLHLCPPCSGQPSLRLAGGSEVRFTESWSKARRLVIEKPPNLQGGLQLRALKRTGLPSPWCPRLKVLTEFGTIQNGSEIRCLS